MNNEILMCTLISILLCLLLYRYLSNRVVEIEKFSNHQVEF